MLFGAIAFAGAAGPTWGGLACGVGVAMGGAMVVGRGILSCRGVLDRRENLMPFRSRWPGLASLRQAHMGWFAIRSTAASSSGPRLGAADAAAARVLDAALLIGFFDLKARHEPTWLAEQFPDSPNYRGRTRRILLWLY